MKSNENNFSKTNDEIIKKEELNNISNTKGINEELKKENSLLNKKTKPSDEIPMNNLNNESNNKMKKIDDNIENKDNKNEYDFGYSLIFLEDNEEGLMEDFLKEKPIISDISDFYNYGLDKEKFDKMVQDSLLIHYERHLKEEMEKRKQMQKMFMFNMNINMNNNIIPTSMMPQVNSLMMSNLNNSNNNNDNNYSIPKEQLQNKNQNN